jgi:hypothetical protein
MEEFLIPLYFTPNVGVYFDTALSIEARYMFGALSAVLQDSESCRLDLPSFREIIYASSFSKLEGNAELFRLFDELMLFDYIEYSPINSTCIAFAFTDKCNESLKKHYNMRTILMNKHIAESHRERKS